MLVVTMALLVSLIASFGSAADTKPKAKKSETSKTTTEAKAPRLTIVQPVKDYGTIPKGEKLEWSFEIKNTGNADLLILAAKPGCGCTVADFDKVIKPGQTGHVTAHVDTTNFSGPIAKPVTLETNDPTTPTAQLTINAIVKPYVEAHPAGFVRFQLLQGETETQSVTLYSDEEEPFEIKEVQVPPDENYIKVTTNKIENEADRVPGIGQPGQNQYKVNITVGGTDAKIGPLADRLGLIVTYRYCILVLGACFSLWLYGKSYGMLVGFALVMGASYGGAVALTPAVVAELFGTRGLGVILGTLYTGSAIGTLLGPPFCGALIDRTGSYRLAILFTMAVTIASYVILLPLERREAERYD